MTIQITSNYQWNEFLTRDEVPSTVLNDQFDHLEDANDGFFQHGGRWFHLEDFMRVSDNSPFEGEWHGYHSDSFFSGVLIQFSNCGEGYRAATYIS